MNIAGYRIEILQTKHQIVKTVKIFPHTLEAETKQPGD
ncbi:MAG: hypothetical protein Q7J23_06530 [Nitrosomonas sp.]|nr:hypothetical protein [Nitrosomonas sp.]MDO9470363.1 hypothetical protein [Nitrosomonas sp.]MDP2222896.1 hypothetical protein [Nitrosomonas sp.]